MSVIKHKHYNNIDASLGINHSLMFMHKQTILRVYNLFKIGMYVFIPLTFSFNTLYFHKSQDIYLSLCTGTLNNVYSSSSFHTQRFYVVRMC